MEGKPTFNYKEFEDETIKRLQDGAPLEGKDGFLGPLIKRLIEAGLLWIVITFQFTKQA